MSDRTPEQIQAEIEAAHSAEKALEEELVGAKAEEAKAEEVLAPVEVVVEAPVAPKVNWHPSGGQEVSLMIRASQAGLVRVPGEPITKDEVVAFLASKGLS